MTLAFLIIGSVYLGLILLLFLGNSSLKPFKETSTIAVASKTSSIKFTIVVPFRNEKNRISHLLKSINQLAFPRSDFEVLFVDDDSKDTSVSIIKESINKNINFQILKNNRLSNSPKKDAITHAISKANYEWILTTDADCTLPKAWLGIYTQFISTQNPLLICGPVKYKTDGSFLHSFQQLDALSLQWVAMGSFGLKKPIIANGANMAYRKSLFESLNGFEGNDTIASGDDIFMLEKAIKHHPEGVVFLKNNLATVITEPEQSWQDSINQRVRWASKTRMLTNVFSKGIGLLVFAANVLLLIGFIWCFFDASVVAVLMLYALTKLILDALALYISSLFFGVKLNVIPVIKSAIVYPLITVLVVFKSINGNYRWKDRDF